MSVKSNYFWINKLYDENECKQIVDISLQYKDERPTDVGAPGKSVSVTTTPLWEYDRLLEKFFYNLNSINKQFYDFNLHPIGEVANRINLNYYRAEDSNEYPWHRDSDPISPYAEIKLTAILNVSQEPYEGGEFEFFLGNGNDGALPDINEPGTMIVFPSWLYHRVKPVTKGTRITLSYWALGPNFK